MCLYERLIGSRAIEKKEKNRFEISIELTSK